MPAVTVSMEGGKKEQDATARKDKIPDYFNLIKAIGLSMS